MYGFGFSAKGIKDGIFQLFLFFYFSQVLGLDAALAGTSTVVALVFDAISDPLVGMLSDKWKSKKWGRRHPFMLASALPLGLFIYLLFLPPEGLGQMGLFWWLTIFTILVRLSLTLFLVPGMSLGAELTDDYEDRTSVTAYRIMFAALVAPFVIIFGLVFMFTPTEEMSNGLFNAEAYPKFALLCGVLITLIILFSTWATRDSIPYLPQANDTETRVTVKDIFANLALAFKMKSYRTLVLFVMTIYIAIGIGTIFIPYFTTYYFGLSEKELALLPLASAVGGIASLIFAPLMGKRLDKRQSTIIGTVFFALFFSLPFSLKLMGLFPENENPLSLYLYVSCNTVAYSFMFVTLSIANSMMADVTDEHELNTGEREEGLFFSTMSFAYKCTVGLGYFLAGILLNIIAFPKQADVADVPVETIRSLGLIGGPVLFLIYIFALFFIVSYPISRTRYQEIRAALEEKKM